MCPITFWKHECFFCGAVKDNASLYDPEITSVCPGCASPVEVELEWRLWICPPCEEERATAQPKYPPTGQRPQGGVRTYMFPNETQRQNGLQRQNEPRFQDAPRFQPFQNNPRGHRVAQQYPAQQGEQRPQYFQMGHPPRVQYEPADRVVVRAVTTMTTTTTTTR
ncbi:uncharacterized protein FPRO_15495 [Fusarium proliferatum ET1]|uniref:Uncharacterized protein n=1 Tax=Fusarium proliferatum (strain ET1) TaxID=1227346 RepID=A0A1L7VY20_FUSPR|nr:uncharacterized protein FPRO_15495 [Fusarium proliferatum ET1]CZR45330.1 uncharacterized protein FPRO_15495 [Fusarium proliferatum ET1]